MRRADPKRESFRPALRAATVRVMDDARITGSSTAAPVTATVTVTAETAAALSRDGVACVPGVLNPYQVAAAYDIRRFELAPGDAIFFDFLTVSGAPGFPFDSRRRVLSVRYLSADARHAPRHWRTSPLFDGLDAARNSRTWSQTRRARGDGRRLTLITRLPRRAHEVLRPG